MSSYRQTARATRARPGTGPATSSPVEMCIRDRDPDTEVVTTIGAKEGLSHLMWVLVGPGDTALVPSPSYPIHIYAPLFAGADVRNVRLDAPGAENGGSPGEAFFDNLMEAWESAWPKPRVVVLLSLIHI